jgi:membrane-associated phospholipid phosphatase
MRIRQRNANRIATAARGALPRPGRSRALAEMVAICWVIFSAELHAGEFDPLCDLGGTGLANMTDRYDSYEPLLLDHPAVSVPVPISLLAGEQSADHRGEPDSNLLPPLPEIDQRFEQADPNFVELDDWASHPREEPVEYYTQPIERRTWSTVGGGMSLGQSVRNDIAMGFFSLQGDFLDFWKPRNVLFVGSGLGIGIGLRQSADQRTRYYVNQHPRRWGSLTKPLGYLGNTEIQVAAIAVLYGYAFQTENVELLEFTQLLVRTYSLTGLSTLLIKAIANTDRPSTEWVGGHFGFPSAHTSTSFAIAATVEEYYGLGAGIPAYLLAGMIGWSRIDDRHHDLSDVVFGAILGYAIAKSVSGRHLRGDSRIQFFPWTDPQQGSYGMMFQVDY